MSKSFDHVRHLFSLCSLALLLASVICLVCVDQSQPRWQTRDPAALVAVGVPVPDREAMGVSAS